MADKAKSMVLTLMKRRAELENRLDSLEPVEAQGRFRRKATAEDVSNFQAARRTLLKKIAEIDEKLDKLPDIETRFP